MLTICGLRRRGVRPSGIKNFCDAIGITNTDSEHPMFLLENEIREDLEAYCERRMVVEDPLEVEIVDYEGRTW